MLIVFFLKILCDLSSSNLATFFLRTFIFFYCPQTPQNVHFFFYCPQTFSFLPQNYLLHVPQIWKAFFLKTICFMCLKSGKFSSSKLWFLYFPQMYSSLPQNFDSFLPQSFDCFWSSSDVSFSSSILWQLYALLDHCLFLMKEIKDDHDLLS